jgi:hypothetical protein
MLFQSVRRERWLVTLMSYNSTGLDLILISGHWSLVALFRHSRAGSYPSFPRRRESSQTNAHPQGVSLLLDTRFRGYDKGYSLLVDDGARLSRV